MNLKQYLIIGLLVVSVVLPYKGYSQARAMGLLRFDVTLKEAHIGNLEIDTKLLDSYELLPENERQFYLDARKIFSTRQTNFIDPQIIESARRNNITLISGPLLGDLQSDGINLCLRPSTTKRLKIQVLGSNGEKLKKYTLKPKVPGQEQRLEVNGLLPNTNYNFEVFAKKEKLATGSFRTAPESDQKEQVRITFSSGFHKIGVHNPNLINTILKRAPQAMLLTGDLAVDDRENDFSMHRSDYLLRDIAKPWKKLASNTALYATWDDHDYINNDLAGVPERFTNADRDELRKLWRENWNNPPNEAEGLYFNSRIGKVE
ncbi:MAG: alkaline phosphatase family protein, partial [Bacteroidota bacterium]